MVRGGLRVTLKGVHTVRRKLADGSVRVHRYAWRGGPRLEGEPGSMEFMASYNRAIESRKALPPESFAWLVARYKESRAHTSLTPKNRNQEGRLLDRALDEFATAPIRIFDDVRMRKDIREWHERQAATPRQADLALGTLRKVLNFAMSDGLIAHNPASGHAQLHKSNRAEIIWTESDLEAICAVASSELTSAILLSARAGISRTDLTKLSWKEVGQHDIEYRRTKTNSFACCPLYDEIQAIIASIPKRGPLVLTNTRGLPWTPDGLSTAFYKARKKAGLEHLRFHDLRGTAVSFLYGQGLGDEEVAEIVGWEVKDVRSIKRRYVSREAVASALIARLKRTKTV